MMGERGDSMITSASSSIFGECSEPYFERFFHLRWESSRRYRQSSFGAELVQIDIMAYLVVCGQTGYSPALEMAIGAFGSQGLKLPRTFIPGVWLMWACGSGPSVCTASMELTARLTAVRLYG